MDLGVVASILGSLASIFVGVRWLLSVYFKQQMKVEATRKENFLLKQGILEEDLREVKIQIRLHREELKAVLLKSDEMIKTFGASRESAEKVYESLKTFVDSTYKRFEKIENGHKFLPDPPDEIEMGATIVKGLAEPPPPQNIGKVIVKK